MKKHTVIVLVIGIGMSLTSIFAMAQASSPATAVALPPSPAPQITELEKLQGQKLVLTIQNLDMQMELLRQQAAQIQKARGEAEAQLAAHEGKVLAAHGTDASHSAVDWGSGAVATRPPTPSPTTKQQ